MGGCRNDLDQTLAQAIWAYSAYQGRQLGTGSKPLSLKVIVAPANEGCSTSEITLDVRSANLTGKVAEKVLGKTHITVNKNMIPFDPESPFVTSGVRLGTPAVTSRGMKEAEMDHIAEWIAQSLFNHKDEDRLAEIAEQVIGFCRRFPLPGV